MEKEWSRERLEFFLSHIDQHLIWKHRAINVPRLSRRCQMRETRIDNFHVLLRLFGLFGLSRGWSDAEWRWLTSRRTFLIILNSRKSTNLRLARLPGDRDSISLQIAKAGGPFRFVKRTIPFVFGRATALFLGERHLYKWETRRNRNDWDATLFGHFHFSSEIRYAQNAP